LRRKRRDDKEVGSLFLSFGSGCIQGQRRKSHCLGETWEADSYGSGPKSEEMENSSEWISEKIREKANSLSSSKGSIGSVDD